MNLLLHWPCITTLLLHLPSSAVAYDRQIATLQCSIAAKVPTPQGQWENVPVSTAQPGQSIILLQYYFGPATILTLLSYTKI